MSSKKDLSIDKLIENARSCLKDVTERYAVPLRLPEVSFWLEKRNILGVAEESVKIKDISEIKPDSRVNMEVDFELGPLTYRLIVRTVVTEDGIFQLRHPELWDICYPYDTPSPWETAKKFAKENAVGLASLLVSLFNAALNIMRLGKPP